METVNIQTYLNDINNLLLINGNSYSLIKRENIQYLLNFSDKSNYSNIIFECYNKDTAYIPRKENIIDKEYYNLQSIGIHGVIVPLNDVYHILSTNKQIFNIEEKNNKTSPFASLNTILGSDVVSSNYCQEEIPMTIGKLYYIEKNKFLNILNGKNKQKTKSVRNIINKTKKRNKTKSATNIINKTKSVRNIINKTKKA